MTENVLFIDTMQKAQHERWDGGVVGWHVGKEVVLRMMSRGWGGWLSIMSDAFKTQTIMKRYQVPASSGLVQKKLYAKKPVVVYRKVTFTYVVPGW